MNKNEQDILQQILGNNILLNVLKKAFKEEIDKNIPRVNDIDGDDVLGQKYRAYIEAQDLIQKCWLKIESHKTEKGLKKDLNKAR